MNLTEPQLDFILEMYAKDHPDEYEFRRPGQPKIPPASELLAAWETKLIKSASREFWQKALPSAAVLKRAAELDGALAAIKRVKRDANDKSDGERSRAESPAKPYPDRRG